MIYLAIPYTGQEEFSFSLATAIAAELTARGEVVYSPITHSHPMTKVKELPGTWEFWEKIDREFISKCEKMYVICADGWEVSTGVQAEIKLSIHTDYYDDWKEEIVERELFYLRVDKRCDGYVISGLDIKDFYINNSDLFV